MGKLWLRLSRRVNLTTQKHSTLRSGGGRNIRRYHFAWIDDPIEGSDQGQFASRWLLACLGRKRVSRSRTFADADRNVVLYGPGLGS